MKQCLLFLIIIIVLSVIGCVNNNANTQYGDNVSKYYQQWNHTYNNSYDSLILNDVIPTSDGGYIGIGDGTAPLYIIKMGASGNELWNCSYYGTTGRSIIQDPDGSYIILGTTNNYSPYAATYFFNNSFINVTKINSSGLIQWSRNYGTGKINEPSSIIVLSDGDYALTGYTIPSGDNQNKSAYLVKIDKKGNMIWNNTYGNNSEGMNVRQEADGGYLLLGISWPPTRLFYVKTDPGGKELWENYYSAWAMTPHVGTTKTDDGGNIICATADDNYGIRIIKTDKFGNEQWNNSITTMCENTTRNIRQENGEGLWVSRASNNTFLVIGFSVSYSQNYLDIFNVDNDGKLNGNITYIPIGNNHVNFIYPTSDGGFLAVGGYNKDIAPPSNWESIFRYDSYIIKIGYNPG